MSSAIKCISDFIFVTTPIKPSDLILVPGGSHPQLMEEAARLYKAGFAPLILPSGGKNPNILNGSSEWKFLRDLGVSLGVPGEAILKEDQAGTFDISIFFPQRNRISCVTCC